MPKPSDTLNEAGGEIRVRRKHHEPHVAGELQQPTEAEAEQSQAVPPSAAGDTAAEAAGAPGEATAAALTEDVQEIARERDDYYDRLLRKTAELENYRKRVERERRELAEYAAADILTELLPLIDDLERALVADSETGAEAYRKGVELIHAQMLELLRKRGVTPIEAVGHQFDPYLHQAVTHEVAPGHPEGEVVEELRRGYKLRGRLLRPAMVKVAKA